jgi:hypothetical protein
MTRMSFDDDRAGRGQRRGCIAARHGKRQRKIAGGPNRHWPDRHQCPPQIGTPCRLPVGYGGIHSHAFPGPILYQPGKQAKLVGGARSLAGQPRYRQSRFLRSQVDQLFPECVDLGRNPVEKAGDLPSGHGGQVFHATIGQRHRALDLLRRGFRVGRFQSFAAGRRRRTKLGGSQR